MVLSNKKLKQRLRAELAESLTKTVIESDPRKPDLKAQPQLSLKELIDSAASKPRLTKREKRRKIISLQGPEAVKRRRSSVGGESEENKGDEEEKEGGSESLVEKKKKKKRKREEEEEAVKEGDLGSEENGVVKEAKKSNKKKKKKGKKKKNKKGKSEEEENNGAELGSEEKVVMETNNNDESQPYEEVAKKVYAGGIPYYSTEDDIRSYFDGCGTITEIDCMKFPETGKFRGIAIITFKTDAAAKRALALDGSDMGGLYLKIQPYNYKATRVNKVPDFAPKIVEGYNRIYVGNLSWDITEDELRKFFSDCNISSIRFGEDKETGEFRGYAHVDLSDSLSLTMALKLDQQIVCGRPAKISCAVPMKGGGGGTQSRSAPTSQVADNAGPNPGSGKADNAEPNPGSGKADNAEPILGSGKADNTEPIPGSGKIRRRTCYECGEKGHLSSACPNKQNADPTNGARLTMALKLDQQIVCGRPAKISCAVPMEGGAGTQSRSAPTSQVADNAGPNPGSGKADNAEPSLGSGKADNTEPIPGSGKIRRRTCYECGEKGHLSSACPNKQNADPTNGAR